MDTKKYCVAYIDRDTGTIGTFSKPMPWNELQETYYAYLDNDMFDACGVLIVPIDVDE